MTLCINIGEIPILVHTDSAEFARLLENRYGPFVVAAGPSGDPPRKETASEKQEARGKNKPAEGEQDSGAHRKSNVSATRVSNFEFPVPSFELEIELTPPGTVTDAEDVRVRMEGGRWVMERGDFRAEWDPTRGQGWVRQSANPYAIDSVLRILHSLILARQGGFLLHAASAIRNGRAFLFAGVSGAGKTTICRLAPPDVALLTDEISYVRKIRNQKSEVRSQNEDRYSMTPHTRNLTPAFEAFGTPFAGELARIGENLRAPVAALYLLAQGAENRIEPVSDADAVRALLQDILFFAQDEELVRLVFQSAFDFVSRVSVSRLVFAPDRRVWQIIK